MFPALRPQRTARPLRGAATGARRSYRKGVTFNRRSFAVAASARGRRGQLSGCAADFLKTLLNPFDAPAGACLPAGLFPQASQKMKLMARQEISSTVMAADGSYIMLVPNTDGASFACHASSIPFLQVLSSGAVSRATLLSRRLSPENLPAANAAGFDGVVAPPTWSGPLPYTDVMSNANLIRGRRVAYGIRIRYVGAPTACTGQIYLIEKATGQSMMYTGNLETVQNGITSADQTRLVNVPATGAWVDLVWSGPSSQSEIDFQPLTSLGPNGAWAILITGLPPAATPFIVEAYCHVEFCGPNVLSQTPGHADNLGFSSVVAASKAMIPAQGPLHTSNLGAVAARVRNVLAEGVSTAASSATAYVAPRISKYAGRAAHYVARTAWRGAKRRMGLSVKG